MLTLLEAVSGPLLVKLGLLPVCMQTFPRTGNDDTGTWKGLHSLGNDTDRSKQILRKKLLKGQLSTEDL